MWYFKKIESSSEQFSQVYTFLCPKYIKFCYKNLGNVREDKNVCKWTTFGFNHEKKISVYFAKIEHFFHFWNQK